MHITLTETELKPWTKNRGTDRTVGYPFVTVGGGKKRTQNAEKADWRQMKTWWKVYLKNLKQPDNY